MSKQTRTVEEVMIYSLELNSIMANFESRNTVAFTYSEESLMEWYKSQITETYEEDGYFKNFKKGGPLEMYNLLETTGDVFSNWYQESDMLDYIEQAKKSFGLVAVPHLIQEPTHD